MYAFSIQKEDTLLSVGLHQKDVRTFCADKGYHNFDTDLQLILLKITEEGVDCIDVSDS